MESYSILRPLNFDSHVLKSKSSKFHIFSELLPTQAIICNLLLCVIFYESKFLVRDIKASCVKCLRFSFHEFSSITFK